MELTLDQALQKGIEAYKTGKTEEADRHYTAILKVNPEYSDANHNMALLGWGVIDYLFIAAILNAAFRVGI